jgi:putative phosphoribosyl transferase
MEEVKIKDRLELDGHLVVPKNLKGVVIFAHGHGSSRHSPRNAHVAKALNEAGIATLLFDLLTDEEAKERGLPLSISVLSRRVGIATDWVKLRFKDEIKKGLPIGYFGTSSGAAAALWSAAERSGEIAAVVSRGGRPDQASLRLTDVTCPTLLIVGEKDEEHLALNQTALEMLHGGNMVVVPGATHLFEERGALETVAKHAVAWFERHFAKDTAKDIKEKVAA